MPTAAAIIAQRLALAGCRHAFGVPGGEVLTLIDALAGAGITFHLTRHENAAGFMAEGTWQATGAPGILVATLGPGVTNGLTAVANALQERVPLIVLTGRIGAGAEQGFTHQIIDHGAVMGPLVKASFTAAAGTVDLCIDKALAIATDGQPGPVHIDLPLTLAATEQPAPRPPRRPRTAPSAPAPGPDLDQARAWLAGAERPLMIAGVDAVNHDAGAAITAFARRFSVPVLTTYKGKGLMPEDDPLSLGGAGLSPRADTALMPLVEQADLILLAGYDPIEMRVGWCDPWPADKRVVAFSAVPNTHFVHPESLSFVGHVGAGLEALAQGGTPRPVWSNGAPGATRDELARLFPTDEAWGPAAIADTVCKSLPEHGIATVDTGAHRILLSQVWKAARPRGLLQSSGFCTMGPAMPQALGVKLADPDRPVVALVGDGGLEMMLGDLATARDLGLAVPIVVFADRSLALIEMKQRTSGLDNRGVDFGTTDFPAVARALGGRGVEATDRAALAAAVTEALSADRFTVIACPFDRKAYDGRF